MVNVSQFLDEKRSNLVKYLEQSFSKEIEYNNFITMFDELKKAKIENFAAFIKQVVTPCESKLDDFLKEMCKKIKFDHSRIKYEQKEMIKNYLICFITVCKEI